MIEKLKKNKALIGLIFTVGAALFTVGMVWVAAGVKGEDMLDLARRFVQPAHTYIPNPSNKEVYDRNYSVFKGLYKANASAFRKLNALA